MTAIEVTDVFFATEQAGKELLFRGDTRPQKNPHTLLVNLGSQLSEQPPLRITEHGRLLD